MPPATQPQRQTRVLDIRTGLTRNIQSFQAMQSGSPSADVWLLASGELLREHRALVIERAGIEPQRALDRLHHLARSESTRLNSSHT